MMGGGVWSPVTLIIADGSTLVKRYFSPPAIHTAKGATPCPVNVHFSHNVT